MKHSIIKKLLTITIVMILTIIVLVVPVNAYTYTTPNYATSNALAGSWQSELTLNILSSYDQIYGGDVGVFFHARNYGLSSAFVVSTSRKAYAQLKEDDSLADELVREYTHYFGTYNGYYRPVSVANTSTSSSLIETDNRAELYLRFKVETMDNDKSKNVDSGILYYQFWSN